jgi:hypothetical protein
VNCESGQATVEWVGLLLLVTLVLGGLLTLAPRVEGRSLGGAVAHAIACGAAGDCDAAGRAGSRAALPPVVPRAPRRARRPGRLRLPSLPRLPVSPDRVAAAYHALRGVKAVAARAWIVCLGYKRFQYERRHPEMTISGRMPVPEALRIADSCLNPLAFLGEDG